MPPPRRPGDVIRLRRGLDLAIPGAPAQTLQGHVTSRTVCVLADDYPGLRVSPEVSVGDRVRVGQPVLVDNRQPEIRIPAPAAGSVAALHRTGGRLAGVEIEVDGDAHREFPRTDLEELARWSREQTARRLLDSGDWAALRQRPFGTLADPGTSPAAIFVRAMDSNPFAVDATWVLRDRLDDFRFGLSALVRLTEGPVFVCTRPAAFDRPLEIAGVEPVEFAGPHPAGLVGTHIHHLLPVSDTRSVWYASYQDVIAVGHLLRVGRPDPSRVVSIAGPAIANPRIVRTTLGASTESLIAGELATAQCRVISGSVLSGRVAARPVGFLGRYHEQISVLAERARSGGGSRWRSVLPGSRWRSVFADWTAELHGTQHAFFPLDAFERVFPLSVPVGPLLRALVAGDTRSAIALGALELEEEDLALCGYHCAAKIEYGPLLRGVLNAAADALS